MISKLKLIDFKIEMDTIKIEKIYKLPFTKIKRGRDAKKWKS